MRLQFDIFVIMDHHSSSASSGHFTSTLIHKDTLYRCNGNAISTGPVCINYNSSPAYMLFYKLLTKHGSKQYLIPQA